MTVEGKATLTNNVKNIVNSVAAHQKIMPYLSTLAQRRMSQEKKTTTIAAKASITLNVILNPRNSAHRVVTINNALKEN